MSRMIVTGRALLVAVVAVFAIVMMLPAAGARVSTQAQPRPADTTPVFMPDHHYDLPATLITADQIEAHKKKMLEVKRDDIPMNMVKMGGAGDKKQVGISIVYRVKGQSNPNYAVHDDVAEVYYVLEGLGRMKLGGHLTDAKRRPVSAGNGRGSSGTMSQGAKDITIKKGDVLIIPAGTPHQWVMADEFTAYVVVRIDPDGVAPLMELGTAQFKAATQQ